MNCMGGWCLKRQNCVYYWQESYMTMERLCEPDNTDSYERVTVNFPASVPRKVAYSVPDQGQTSSPRLARKIQEAASDIYA
jgi:hypothetical protein